MRRITLDGGISFSDMEAPTNGSDNWKILRSKLCSFHLKLCPNVRFSLYILMVLYLVAGTLVFRYIEGGRQSYTDTTLNLTKLHLEIVADLWNAKLDDENWTPVAMEKLSNFSQILEDAILQSKVPNSDWSTLSALVFCLTVITTIGYGHVTPSTTAGKLVCVVYAAFGVPLMLLFLAHVGNCLARFADSLYANLRTCVMARSGAVSNASPVEVDVDGAFPSTGTDFGGRYIWDGVTGKIMRTELMPSFARSRDQGSQVCEDDLEKVMTDKEEYGIPACVVLATMTCFILIGSMVEYLWHDWAYCDSFYFTATTLLTIGFGDILPNDRSSAYFIYWSLYVVTGLAMMSMCVTLLQRTVVQHVRKLGQLLRGQS